MAEILTEWPVVRRGRKPGGQYSAFLDGKIYRLVAGVDVASLSKETVDNGLRAAAKSRGCRVHIHLESRDPLTFIVQAVPKDAK